MKSTLQVQPKENEEQAITDQIIQAISEYERGGFDPRLNVR